MIWAPLPMWFGVGKADTPCGGEDLQDTCLDAQDFLDQQVDGFG
jgi:hypothetical protein